MGVSGESILHSFEFMKKKKNSFKSGDFILILNLITAYVTLRKLFEQEF